MDTGEIGITQSDGFIYNVKGESQGPFLRSQGITEGWEMIKINNNRFSNELLRQAQDGNEKYTIEFIKKTNVTQ